MSKQLTRRQFGKLAAAGVGAAAAAATGLGIDTGTAEAFAPGFIDRFRGPVYTSGSLDNLQNCMNHGAYNMKKVVTAWGQGGAYYPNPWPQSEITRVAIGIQGTTVVRTYRGDGSDKDRPPDWAYPIDTDIVNEIRPWYNTQPWIWIELGNEPNGYAGWIKWARTTYPSWFSGHEGDSLYVPPQMQSGSSYDSRADAFIWNWRYWLGQAITACQNNFQVSRPDGAKATIVSPGLAALNPGRWFAIASDYMKRCNYIGFHAFHEYGFNGNNNLLGDLDQIVPLLKQYFPTQNLLMTEYGIHSSSTTDDAKGRKYAEMMHFNISKPVLPGNTRGGLYFHRSITSQPEYDIYVSGDDAYKTRITTG